MKGPTTNITTGRKPSTTTTSSIQNHLATRPRQSEVYEDYSEAVENWRLKREEKRKQSVKPTQSDDDPPLSSPPIIESPPTSFVKKSNETEFKTNLPSPSPPIVVLSSPTTNESTDHLTVKNRIPLKSPSPQRIKGPAKIHEIYIQKPVDIRGFGFKLDGGTVHNRPIYISTLEDGSPADKAGLCVEDEIVFMHGENIEHMTFDQVRKILKERNLRGSIRLVVRTYEDIVDDNSSALTVGPTAEHSRTPSPQKLPSNSQPATLPVSPPPTTSRTIPVTSPTPSNTHAPIYKFSPYTPPSSSVSTADTTLNTPIQPSSVSSMNMFGPKPFRSTASINLDKQNSNENTTSFTEQQSSAVSKITSYEIATTPPPNPVSISSDSTYSLSSSSSSSNTIATMKAKAPPPPLTSVESLLHGTSDNNNHDQQNKDSLIIQARSSVEQQMNQLQQELLRNYPHTQASRDQRSVNIPIDTSNIVKLSSNPQQNSSVTNNNNRIYGIKVNSNENTDSPNSQQISPSYPKRSIQDIPSLFTNTATTNTAVNHPPTTYSTDRPINEIKINLLTPTSNQQQQKKPSIQVDEKKPQQRITNKQLHTTFNQVPKKSPHEHQSWINNTEQNKPIVLLPAQQQQQQTSTHKNGKILSNHRPPPPVPQQQDVQKNIATSKQLSMFHYGDTSDDLHYRPLRSAQNQHDVEPSIHRQHQLKNRPKSPVRTTINSNNNRVLSVSGKLHCSRCNEELGQGSAMVIESLGLYYHIECFRCFVCNVPLSSSFEGTDVRVRTNRLHCQNCFSDENGVKSSAV